MSPTPIFTTPSSTIFIMKTTVGAFVPRRTTHFSGPPDSYRILRDEASYQG